MCNRLIGVVFCYVNLIYTQLYINKLFYITLRMHLKHINTLCFFEIYQLVQLIICSYLLILAIACWLTVQKDGNRFCQALLAINWCNHILLIKHSFVCFTFLGLQGCVDQFISSQGVHVLQCGLLHYTQKVMALIPLSLEPELYMKLVIGNIENRNRRQKHSNLHTYVYQGKILISGHLPQTI